MKRILITIPKVCNVNDVVGFSSDEGDASNNEKSMIE